MPASRPTLVVTQPFSLMAIGIMHFAKAARWNVIPNVGLMLPADVREGEIAIYGDWRQVCAIAERNWLSLIAPHSRWLSELPPEFLGRKIEVVTWQQAKNIAEPKFFQSLDEQSEVTGVFDNGGGLPHREDIADDAAMLMSTPVDFEYEFRCFVVDGAVVAISPYNHQGKSCQVRGAWKAPEPLHEEAADFCSTLLADSRVDAPRAFVVDVGLMTGVGWVVVAARPTWCSDPYGCPPPGVLEGLKHSCTSRRNVQLSEQRWVVQGTSLWGG